MGKTLSTRWVVALLCAARTSLLLAQEKGVDQETPRDATVVITSSRLPEVNRAAAVEVIDAEEIAKRNSGSLADLLRQVPGVSVSQPGGPGGVPEIFLRGAESNFTLVMVDGVKMNDPTDARGGAFDLSSVALGEIDRIEIVRGPASAVYGSEALAGVINLITRKSAANALDGTAQLGSHGYESVATQFSQPIGSRAHASLRAQYLDAGEPVQGSSLRTKSAQADLTFDPTDRLSAELGLRYAERSRSTFPDASGGPLLAALRDLERSDAADTRLSTRVRFAISSRWSLDFAGSMFERDDNLATPAIAPGLSDGRPAQTADTRLHRSDFQLSARYVPTQRLSIGFGVDRERTSGLRDSLVDFGGGFALPSDFALRRETTAVFAETWWRASDGLELFAGLRSDDGNGAGDGTGKRVGGSYASDSGIWRLRASWGEGFKLPSFYALGDALVGNPALEQERAISREIGGELHLRSGRVILAASGFSSVYRNLIDFDFTTFRLVNRSRADIDGVELSADLALGAAWHLRLHSTRTHTDLSSGGRLLNRPDRIAGIVASWEPGTRWVVTSALQYVGDRAASSVPTGDVTLGSHTRMDLAARYRLSDAVDLNAALDNLLRERYQDNPGFPAPGRQLRIGLSARL